VDRIAITMTGVPELNQDLKALMTQFHDLAVMRDIAQQTAQLARSFAPSDSGALRASIKGNKAKNKATVKAGSKKVPYAAVINYGWPRRNIKPSMFLQRAEAAMKPRIPKILDDAIKRLIHEGGLG
jgi:hypothetical protein